MIGVLLHMLAWGLENPEESPVGEPRAHQHHTSHAGDIFHVPTFTCTCVKEDLPGAAWSRGLWVALGSAAPLTARVLP